MRGGHGTAGAVIVTVVTFILAAYGGARSGAIVLAAPSAADAAARTAPATAAPNSQLPSQASPPVRDELPIGAGDLIEVSVFEVKEPSNLRPDLSKIERGAPPPEIEKNDGVADFFNDVFGISKGL
jgi:hypothetical protein